MLSFVRHRTLSILRQHPGRAGAVAAVLASMSLAGCSGGSNTETAASTDSAVAQPMMSDTSPTGAPAQMIDPSMMASSGTSQMDPAAMASSYGAGGPATDPSTAGYPGTDPSTAGYPGTDPSTAGYPGADPSTAGYPTTGPATAGYPTTDPSTAGYPTTDPATAAAYSAGADPSLAGMPPTGTDPAAYAAGASATANPDAAGYPGATGPAGYPGGPGSPAAAGDPSIGVTPGGPGYPGGSNGEGAAGGGAAPQAPPKDAPEYPAFMLVSGLISGDVKELNEFVSARGVGILKKISTGQMGEADIKEMKEKLANPMLVGAPRNTRGGRQLVLRSGDNMITILVKKEGGNFKVAEFKISEARR